MSKILDLCLLLVVVLMLTMRNSETVNDLGSGVKLNIYLINEKKLSLVGKRER